MTQGDDSTTDQQTEQQQTDQQRAAHMPEAAAVEQQLLAQASAQYLLNRAAELNAELRRLADVNAQLEQQLADQQLEHADAIKALTDTFEQQLAEVRGEKCDTGPHDTPQTSPA